MAETVYEDFDDAGYSIETDGDTIEIEAAKGTEASLSASELEQVRDFAAENTGFDAEEDIGDFTVIGHSEDSRYDAMIGARGTTVRGQTIFGPDIDGEHLVSLELQHIEDALDAVSAEA